MSLLFIRSNQLEAKGNLFQFNAAHVLIAQNAAKVSLVANKFSDNAFSELFLFGIEQLDVRHNLVLRNALQKKQLGTGISITNLLGKGQMENNLVEENFLGGVLSFFQKKGLH